MTKIKKRILKIGIFALMPILALLLCINNTYAWYDNGDQLVSQNKANVSYSNVINDVKLTVDKDTVVVDGNNTGSDLYFYVNFFSELQTGLTYTMSFTTDVHLVYDTWYNGTRYMCSDEGSMTFTLTDALKASGWRFVVPNGNYINAVCKVMLNTGSTALSYEAYGKTFVNPDTFDYMTYLIGNNYFTSGRAVIFQTNNNTWYDQNIYPTNQTCNYVIAEDKIGKYIDGNTLNMALLISDLVAGLKLQTNYSAGRFTQISIKPALNIGGTATYPPVLGKYIVTEFYCPGYDLPCRTWSGSTVEVGTDGNYSMDWTKQGDSYFIGANGDPNFDDNYLWDICFKLQYDSSAQTYYGPSLVTCHTEDAPVLNNYELGVKSGKEIGYALGKQDGETSGFERGRAAGYQVGLSEGARQNLQTNGMRTLFETILSYPVNMVKETLNFDFMGVNIAGVIMFIVSCGIVIFVLKKFM